MRDHPLIVLKFGGSVIRGERDLRSIAHEVYAHIRDGARVVAVASAIEGTTDRLIRRAARWGGGRSSACAASLIATGEATSAALLGLALRRAGIRAALLNAAQAGLRTRGPVQDAHPHALDVGAVERALEAHEAVVIPGFVGLDERGRTTLLGRGGTDLSALFIAQRLGARCRLVKDVDALYERDPASVPAGEAPPRAYQSLGWDGALALDGTIVQHKAVRFARDASQSFEVGGLRTAAGCREGTRVGASTPEWRSAPVHRASDRKITRVALLGAGTVGLGVYRELCRMRDRFEVVSVLARDHARAAQRGIDPRLLSHSAEQALSRDADVVIELTGDVPLAHRAARSTIESGAHFITANKALIAEFGPELHRLAHSRGVRVAYSGAVGGAMPAIELARQAREQGEVVEIEGILNGTTNAILCDLARGIHFDEAVRNAQRRGLAEADPSRDLSGEDAACKLLILCREAGLASPEVTAIDWIERVALSAESIARVRSAAGSNHVVRVVARARLHDGVLRASVAPETLAPDHPWARVRGPGNALRLTRFCGTSLWAHGTGAGRWPTTQAVIADLLDLCVDEARGPRRVARFETSPGDPHAGSDHARYADCVLNPPEPEVLNVG